MRISTVVALIALGAAELAYLAAPALAKAKVHRRVRETGQIACTVEGCHRIPPNCHPEQGYGVDGIPTGYDIVVCPPQTGK